MVSGFGVDINSHTVSHFITTAKFAQVLVSFVGKRHYDHAGQPGGVGYGFEQLCLGEQPHEFRNGFGLP
jgi:hypothetical protein